MPWKIISDHTTQIWRWNLSMEVFFEGLAMMTDLCFGKIQLFRFLCLKSLLNCPQNVGLSIKRLSGSFYMGFGGHNRRKMYHAEGSIYQIINSAFLARCSRHFVFMIHEMEVSYLAVIERLAIYKMTWALIDSWILTSLMHNPSTGVFLSTLRHCQ